MTHTIGRRAALTAAGMLAAPAMLRAQAWPTRPVTLVVGFPPGGQTDFAARVLQNGLSAALGQPVVIDNRAGASGNIATEQVQRSRPDGYTLLVGNSATHTINPHTFAASTIDPLNVTPIGLMLQSGLILCMHPSVPARDIASLTAWIRAQRGGADYGVSSAGSLTHVAMVLLRNRLGNPPMESIPYRGSGPAIQDLLAGRFPMMFDASSVVASFLRSGQLRGFMATSAQRVPAFPDIPTSAELGLPDFTFTAWIGLFGPPGLPPEIVQRANAALNAATADAAVRERITGLGDEPGGGSAESLGQTMRADHARWGEVVRANNIRAES
jgi:tripartite-type tricarboxylate transporter receptor subunit TctC